MFTEENYSPSPTPLEAIEEIGGPTSCNDCGELFIDEAYFDGETYFCETCITELVDDLTRSATKFAEKNVKITSPISPYDPLLEYRCTPEEYAVGDKASYTPAAYRCCCRYENTNYEMLIKNLDRYALADIVLYHAIKDRANELVDEAIEAAGYPT